MKIKFRKSIMMWAYFYILLPILIIFLVLGISSIYFNRIYSKSIEERYSVWLESASKENELVLSGITKNVQFLETDSDFVRLMRGGLTPDDPGISYNIRQLRRIAESYPIIDSVSIISVGAGMVYSTDGTFNVEEYLNEKYVYDEYDYDYWSHYKEPLAEKQILPPSHVKTPDEDKTVIPIAFTRIGNINTSNILVVNVSLKRILDNLEKESFSDKVLFAVVNRRTNLLFKSSEDTAEKIGTEFRDNIRPRGTVSFDYSYKGTNSLVIAYSPTQSILGYSYISVIPRSVLTSATDNILGIIGIVWLVLFAAVTILARFSAKTLYAPIYRLFKILPPGDIAAENEFSALENYISKSKNVISEQLPFVQEGLLTEYLCTSNPDTEEYKNKFLKSGLKFPYEFFCTVIVRVRFTGQYYRMFSKKQKDRMLRNLCDTLTSMLAVRCKTYNITFDRDSIYVLLCSEDKDIEDYVADVLDEFTLLLKNDGELVQLRTAVGTVERGIDGAKRSHDAAVLELEGVAAPPETDGAAAGGASKKRKHPYGVQEESVLIDYLNAGKIAQARGYINEIVTKSMKKDSSDVMLLNLYVRILNTIINIMRLKNIRYNGSRMDELDIVNEFFVLPPDEMRDAIEKMLDIIEQNVHVSKLNTGEIVSYIQAHYTEDLRLEELAEKYSTSAPYLSRILKDSLGVPFIEYIAVLRVNKAKELLANTDMAVTDISEEVGFASRTAFVRAFKKRTETTPTLYRKSVKKP